MKTPLITFVLIKDKQVQTAETIEADKSAIVRRITKIQCTGFDSCVVIYGEGAKWDISFPMTVFEIEKTAVKLHRNL